MKKELPLQIGSIFTGQMYAGFGSRVGASLLDILVCVPIIVLYSIGLFIYPAYALCLGVVLEIFLFIYRVYIPKKYGGTLGKIWTGLQIIKITGKSIGWKEAILREIISLGLWTIAYILPASLVIQLHSEVLQAMNWQLRAVHFEVIQQQINSSLIMNLFVLLYMLWGAINIIVFACNKKSRKADDYVAKTVVIRKRYLNTINRYMEEPDNEEINSVNQ